MIAELLGRFHPLIVHLPVGMLILAFLMELASRREGYAHLSKALTFVLQITILSALFAFLTGYVMPKEGDFEEALIGQHLYSSLALTISIIAVYYLHQKRDSKLGKFYFPTFLLSMALLGLTGHFGGGLTHGTNHLTSPLGESEENIISDVNTLGAFTGIIQPILKKKCFSCHNEGKKKGGLLMSTIEGLKKGGDEGVIFVAGDIEKSPLVQRLHLPLEEEKHMPPEGKKQVTKNEIKLLEWWISEGADFEKTVGAIEQSDDIKNILKGYEQAKGGINLKKIAPVAAATIASLNSKGIKVLPQSADNPLVQINLSRDTLLQKSTFKKLKSIAENITELDLSFSNMNDGWMSYISSYKNLTKLKLQKSNISSDGIQYLEDLKYLQSLNLYGTKVDNNCLESLKKIKSLKHLYLWQTNINTDEVKAFAETRPLVEVSYGVDKKQFGEAALTSPIISAATDLFNDTMRVELNQDFKNVDIFYTTDGSSPDSSSTKYEAPFLINQTTAIKAISYKKGWLNSDIIERVFIKSGHPIQAIKLDKKPNEKYKANGSKSLIDLEKASNSFGDGKWLGFEGEDVLATINLGSKKQISSVVVGALEDTGSYIFFPKGIEIATSIDGKKFDSKSQLDIPIAKENHASAIKSFLLDFEECSAQFVQVKIFGTLKNPDWHPAPGAKNWVFLDEIIIN